MVYDVGMLIVEQKLGNDERGSVRRTDGILNVGGVRVNGRAFLAPMSGVTDAGMRRVAVRFGAALAVSEMVASDDYVRGEAESRLRAERAGIGTHVVQIAGCESRWMGEAARLAEACGADLVDINMGCPAKRVTGGQAGSALMRDLDHALRLIEATVQAVSIPVTLKMRLGWDGSSCNAPELARRAEHAGVALVTVHARTRCQFYNGSANWPAVRAVKLAVGVPVVVNGDCGDFQDANRMLASSGADAVMVGRAAVGRPWFVGQLSSYLAAGRVPPEPSQPVKLAAALEHYESLLTDFGRTKGVRHARKHLAAYADHVGTAEPRHRARRSRLVTSDDPREVTRLLSEIFDTRIAAEAA